MENSGRSYFATIVAKVGRLVFSRFIFGGFSASFSHFRALSTYLVNCGLIKVDLVSEFWQNRELMRLANFISVALAAFIILLAAFLYFQQRSAQPSSSNLSLIKESAMKLKSLAFENNQIIPAKYTCDGENINPPLEWEGVPNQAKSLVLIVDDPDAPSGTWVHWTVWNISPQTTQIWENSVPAGALEGKTSFGRAGYGGPCPPSGTHRYFFKLYALNTLLDLRENSDIKVLENAIKDRIVDQAELIGLYKR